MLMGMAALGMAQQVEIDVADVKAQVDLELKKIEPVLKMDMAALWPKVEFELGALAPRINTAMQVAMQTKMRARGWGGSAYDQIGRASCRERV